MPTFQCPTCGKVLAGLKRPEEAPYRPFCSERCQLIDLYHWFEGRYRISDPIVSEPSPASPDSEVEEPQ